MEITANLPEIIDFHTHPFLDQYDSICVYEKDTTYDKVPALFKSIGITRICGSVIRPFDPEKPMESIRACNDHAWKLKEIYGDFYIPGIHIHPDYVEESVEEIKKYNALGVNLIGELIPYAHAWSSCVSKGYYEILEEAAARKMIVSFHTMDQNEMDKMVADNPNVTFILAHPGEYHEVVRHIDRMKKHENCCLDLSGTGLFRYQMLKHLVDTVGAERILFGSDYPVCTPAMNIAEVVFEEMADEARELIFSGNAKRLLGL